MLRLDEHSAYMTRAGFAPEVMERLDSRCREFLCWLLATHPKASAVVGHGTYFKRLLGKQLDNCGQTFVSLRRLHSILAVAP